MIEIIKYPPQQIWEKLLQRPTFNFEELEITVSQIIEKVKTNGDEALYEFAEKFDGIDLINLLVTEKEIDESEFLISIDLKDAIALAKSNIEKFHLAQQTVPQKIETQKGVVCWRKSVAIESVGLYIPGGSAPLFSTLLMLGVPATIAKCKTITICTPCNKEGKVHPAILYTAKLLGITTIFKVGGAQAIAAMAYGTTTILKVDKIFGPGNQYVTVAKQLLSKNEVAIDMPAGPSEVAVIADESCVPEFVAADLLSQAEHGADSQVILVSNKEEVLSKVIASLNIQLTDLPRKAIAEKAIANSKFILVETIETAIALVNKYAAEHLILAINNAELFADKIVNAGSVFIGNYSCESAGDYASGTNHTLPTNGYAKSYSGVSLDSFVKKITFQTINKQGLQIIGKAIETMAEAEGLQAHKNAVSIRLK